MRLSLLQPLVRLHLLNSQISLLSQKTGPVVAETREGDRTRIRTLHLQVDSRV